MTVSYTGAQCEHWRLSYEHWYADFPEGTAFNSKNYCRNPSNEHPEGPWCLVLDNYNYFYHEFCDVLLCSSAGGCQHCPWWRYNMETVHKLLAVYEGNTPLIVRFPSQRAINSGIICVLCCYSNPILTNIRWFVLRNNACCDVTVMSLHCPIIHVLFLFCCTLEIWEWICNFIPHFIVDIIAYPCWD